MVNCFKRVNSNSKFETRKCTIFWLIAFLLFIIYANTLNDEWHLDDSPNIKNHERVHVENLSLQELGKSLYNDEGKLSRPIARLSFALNWYFSGEDTTVYHLVNIFVHIFTCFFLYLALLLLLQTPQLPSFFSENKEFIACLAALLWAINPIQTQAVTYIVQRMASMAALFYIMGMFFYLKARLNQRGKCSILYYFATFASFLLAMGCKENAVMLPLSLLLIEICFFHDFSANKNKKYFIVSGAVFLFVLIVGILFFWVFRDHPMEYFSQLSAQFDDRPFTLKERLLTQPRIVLFYISQIFYPIADRLSIAHDPVFSTSFIKPWTTGASILTILAMVLLSFRYMKKARVVSFAILFFFLNHLIESSMFPLEMVFEHRNYLPSLFLFLPVAATLCYGICYYRQRKLKVFEHIISFFAVMLIFLLGTGTYVRNMVWDTNLLLWQDALDKAPSHSRPYTNYGNELKDTDLQKARELQLKALDKRPSRKKKNKMVAYSNLAAICTRNKDYSSAIQYTKKLLSLFPAKVKERKRLVVLYLKNGELNKALAHAKKKKKNKPGDGEALGLKGFILLKMGKPEKAYPVIKDSYVQGPDNIKALLNMASVLMRLDEHFKALKYLQRVKRLDESNLPAFLLIIQNYLERGELESARIHADAVIKRFSINLIQNYFIALDQKTSMTWPVDKKLVIPILKQRLAALNFSD
mgnify:CR=1 FL=1